MASAKKKLDEYHLKILRQLVTLQANKECFDCRQRGPTYVNVTIGSFVCTTCSGMLRGITPPHRVKSISMATFTPEEIDFVKARGNDYCRRTWLGLLDVQQPTKDEQQIKDFMIAKYEKKRYYLDPSVAATMEKAVNGTSGELSHPAVSASKTATVHPHPTTLAFNTSPSASKTNGNNVGNAFTPEPFADFSKLSIPPPCDPFSRPHAPTAAPAPASAPPNSQTAFANFDNNPLFSNSSSTGMPTPVQQPSEDRYAALKDLDCMMKAQTAEPTTEWSTGMSNGVANVWPTPAAFPTASNEGLQATSNPFKGNGTWSTVNNANTGANPFRNSKGMSTEPVWSQTSNGQIPNGFPTSQSMNFPAQKVPWSNNAIGNPFVLGTSPQASHHSSNPFL